MDTIEKALRALSAKERGWVKDILERLAAHDTAHLDIKKLKGRVDIFRVRKGDLRITYRNDGVGISILVIERKSDTTYKNP